MDKQKDQNKTLERQRGILTVLLLLIIIFLTAVTMQLIFNLTERKCYEDLASITHDAIETMDLNIRYDRMSLRLLSGLLAEEGDMDPLSVSRYLAAWDIYSDVATSGILLPDGSALEVSGKYNYASRIMNYRQETAKGEHLSGLQDSLMVSKGKVIRNFVPVKYRGMTMGMLYESIPPAMICEFWLPSPYNGNAAIYLVDRKDGRVLVNSAGDGVQFIEDLTMVDVRDIFSRDEFINGVKHGKRGYCAFRLEGDEAYRYACYMPLESAEWEMVVTVPGEYVFSILYNGRYYMFMLFGIEMVLFILYFVWMLYQTRISIRETEKKTNTDVLTGLPNRNRYEAYMETIGPSVSGLTCVYIDANGLHELNNTKGHDAGDNMLKFIADTIRIAFGDEDSFRIGGDEFVSFIREQDRYALEKLIAVFHEELSRNGYHAAVGYCIGEKGMEVTGLIKTAEMNMYADKKKYYEGTGHERRSR